jgi:hypothetical protein
MSLHQAKSSEPIPALPFRPRMGDIKTASHYSGLSRSSIYEAAKQRPDLFRKLGPRRTLCDFDVLDQILDALPQGLGVEPPELRNGQAAYWLRKPDRHRKTPRRRRTREQGTQRA